MAEPKCPECEGTEFDIKFYNKKLHSFYTHNVSVFYCKECGKIISVESLRR